MSDTRHKLPVFRALTWKEWRQLRLLRLVGSSLSLLVPPLLLAAAAASERGLLPLGSPSSFAVRDVLLDAVPPVMVALWGLLTLLVMAQAFVADRAVGVETFLLTSPVRRRWVFGARLAAATGSIGIIAVIGVLAWVLWALPVAGLDELIGSGGLTVLGVVGVATILVAAAGSLAAVALVPSPLPAVIAGALLAVVPLGLAAALAAAFPFAAFLTLRVGAVVPLLLFPVFGLLSFRVLCVGEPAGRGRFRRAAWVLGCALGGLALLFLTLAPLAVSQAGESHRFGAIVPCPTRALALVVSGWPVPRGWLVDTKTGEARHAFGLAVWNGIWSADGRYLAVVSEAGPLGLRLSSARLEIYDTTHMRVARRLSIRDVGLAEVSRTGSTFTATHLVLAGWNGEGRSRLGVVRLADWQARPLEVDPAFLDAHPWTLVGPGADGTLFLAVAVQPSREDPSPRTALLPAPFVPRQGEKEAILFSGSGLRLHALDAATGTLSAPRLEQEGFGSGNARGLLTLDLDWRLSPSGSYWVASGQGSAGSLRLLAIGGGEPTEIEATLVGRITWLADDTLVWLDREGQQSRLRAWSPATGVMDLHTAGGETELRFQASPDRKKLLVGEKRSSRVYDRETGQWSDVQHAGGWGGPDVLVSWSQDGHLYYPLN